MDEARKPHKHAEVIKAWADGERIQFLSQSTESWTDFTTPGGTPGFSFTFLDWRIKPETVSYRVFLIGSSHVMVSTSPEKEKEYEAMPGFTRWLTDWVEVEVTHNGN